jgi:hypothetical protein
LKDFLSKEADEDGDEENYKKTAFKSTNDSISTVMRFTKNFKNYLENFDLRNNKDKIDVNSNYLSKNSIVLPGSKIFEIMDQGT